MEEFEGRDVASTPFGFPGSLGGGIRNTGRNLTLTRVAMANNRAVGTGPELAAGGAVANVAGGRLSVSRSTFTGNAATAPTTAASGGAVMTDGGSATTVDRGTFADNQALGGDVAGGAIGSGGGALTSYGGSTLAVTSSGFDGNVVRDVAAVGNTVSGG